MAGKVIIVESPGKIKTIQKCLGKEYIVVSSYGHMRDLPKRELNIDIEGGFIPNYEIKQEQRERIKQLKKIAAKSSIVYLASDADREGEAIAWHIKEALNLAPDQFKRIVFLSITKAAIQKALQEPRTLSQPLIEAQQARRLLDRIVGYGLSPVLWKRVKSKLSAGRVQSVALRLITEKEKEIRKCKRTRFYRVSGTFALSNGEALKAELKETLPDYAAAKDFLTHCKEATFTIEQVVQKEVQRQPPPPLMTSTLQQQAAHQLGYSVTKTMTLAQKLYEKGKITYMRTDSLSLAPEAKQAIKRLITSEYGAKYHTARDYKTKSKSAQEAHEAIRPTNVTAAVVSEDSGEQHLYNLIRMRALASQMSAATLRKTTATIAISTLQTPMAAHGEVVTFPGFMVVFQKENRAVLPPLQQGQQLNPTLLEAREGITKPPYRYSEATLVKKLEELEIGRPSTYRSIIATIQVREYVEKASREGKPQTFTHLSLAAGKIEETTKEEMVGSEKNRLFPTTLGIIVSDFLVAHFQRIMDYTFTAKTEEQLDMIANDKMTWKAMLQRFYTPFEEKVTAANNRRTDANFKMVNRLLGKNPKTGQPITATFSRRYGSQIETTDGKEDHPTIHRFPLPKEKLLQYVTLQEALKIVDSPYPKEVGTFEGHPITLHQGPYGYYLKHHDKNYSAPIEGPGKAPDTLDQAQAIAIIQERRERLKPLKTFAIGGKEVNILNGPYGPYIKVGTKNVRIPKKYVPTDLTAERCEEIIKAAPTKRKRRR